MTKVLPRRLRGFTLVELMTGVAIVGILAVLGVVLIGKQLRATQSEEAMTVVQSIRAAEERYRAENRQYLDVSTTLTTYYPGDSDGKKRSFFRSAAPSPPLDALDARWRLLAPTISTPVMFGYAVVAGNPGTPMATPSTANKPVWPTDPVEPWYVIQAEADGNNDGTKCWVVSSSLNGEVYVENEGE